MQDKNCERLDVVVVKSWRKRSTGLTLVVVVPWFLSSWWGAALQGKNEESLIGKIGNKVDSITSRRDKDAKDGWLCNM